MIDWMKMQALADGELAGADQASATSSKTSDPKLQAEYETVLSLKSTLQQHCTSIPNPDLWQATKRRLDAIDSTRRAEKFVGRYAWGLCGVFFLMLVSAATVNRMGHRSLHTSEMARMAAGLSPLSVPAPSDGGIGDVLASAVGDAPVRSQPSDLQLVGIAKGITDGYRMVRLTFADRQGEVALIVVQNAKEVAGVEPNSERNGLCPGKIGDMNCVSWNEGEYALVLVGDRSTPDLELIAADMRASRQ